MRPSLVHAASTLLEIRPAVLATHQAQPEQAGWLLVPPLPATLAKRICRPPPSRKTLSIRSSHTCLHSFSFSPQYPWRLRCRSTSNDLNGTPGGCRQRSVVFMYFQQKKQTSSKMPYAASAASALCRTARPPPSNPPARTSDITSGATSLKPERFVGRAGGRESRRVGGEMRVIFRGCDNSIGDSISVSVEVVDLEMVTLLWWCPRWRSLSSHQRDSIYRDLLRVYFRGVHAHNEKFLWRYLQT